MAGLDLASSGRFTDGMTPDEHRTEAKRYLESAEDIWREALDRYPREDPRWPDIHREVQTLAALAQAHAALAGPQTPGLKGHPGPSGAGPAKPGSSTHLVPPPPNRVPPKPDHIPTNEPLDMGLPPVRPPDADEE